MKKLILMASAALAFGGVAVAQDPTQPPATGMATPDAASQPGGTPDMGAQPPAGQTAPDANGGMAPPPANGGDMGQGAQQPGGAMQGGMQGTATGPNGPVSTTPTQGPTDLPACSRTVTDNCKQGAGSTSHGGRHAMHHRRTHRSK